jgi:L-rhamnose mutarotase
VIVERHAAVIRLRPERRSEYARLHAQVWSEVLAALKRAHVSNYSIFLRDDYLFSYLEYTGENFVTDMETVAGDPATRRWWELTAPCQAPLPSAADGEWWAPAEELFHLD